MICMAKKKAAIKRRESDFCISKDWFDDRRYDPYKHKSIAIHINQCNCFLKITREIIPTNGTYKVLKKAALEICDFCKAYC